MLKWIQGGKVDHPMGDAKQARALLAELPADHGKAVIEICDWLHSVSQTEGFRIERRFEVVDALDSASKAYHRKLTQDYLGISRQQKFHEHKLWNSAFGLWQELGNAYLACIAQAASGSSTGFRKSLPVVVARALRALTVQVKWVLLRYGKVEPRLWTEIARLYQSAEALGYAESQLTLYPGPRGTGSVQQQFLTAMMLSVSATDVLSPVKQEIAERIVTYLSPAFRMERSPTASCRYAFDLGTDKGPYRVLQGAEESTTLRYFGAGEALPQVERLHAELKAKGVLPSDVHLGGVYEKDVVLAVLQHLALYWSEKPPSRKSERRPIATRLTVVPGLAQTVGTIDPAAGDPSSLTPESPGDSWVVENMSAAGYGAIVPADRSDWVKIGGLVGLQSETSRHWGVGVIRRVSRDDHRQRRVGIQLLTQAAIPIQLSSAGAPDKEQAILLATSPDRNGEVGVLMREGIFNARTSLEMTVNEKSYLLMPAAMVEGGEDFDWARFKVMQRSVASAEE